MTNSTPRTELTASWNPAVLEGFQISSRKPTSHHIGVSIFQRTKVTSMFFNARTLECQSPDSRLLSPTSKVISPPETILTPTRANPQSLSSSGIVHPIVPFELIGTFQSKKKDCQIFLHDLDPDTDFSETGREGFP